MLQKKNSIGWLIASTLSFVVMLVINALSNTGFIKGETMKSISMKYENFFTPAGYTFSIWGVIYLSLMVFVGYSIFIALRKRETLVSDRLLKQFTFLNGLNAIWIVVWLNSRPGMALLIMLAMLLTLISILIKEQMCLKDSPLMSFLAIQWPFSLYLGWIIAAFIANSSAFLTSVGFTGGALAPQTWTVIMLAVAVLVYLFLLVTRNTRVLNLVGVWALFGIAIKNVDQSEMVFMSAMVGAIIIFASTALHGFINRNETPFREGKRF